MLQVLHITFIKKPTHNCKWVVDCVLHTHETFFPNFFIYFLQAVTVHIMFLVVEIFIGILFVFACVNLRNSKHKNSQPTSNTKDDEVPVCSTPIKRRHSHEDKSVYLSDHHIEEIIFSKRRCSLDRKF